MPSCQWDSNVVLRGLSHSKPCILSFCVITFLQDIELSYPIGLLQVVQSLQQDERFNDATAEDQLRQCWRFEDVVEVTRNWVEHSTFCIIVNLPTFDRMNHFFPPKFALDRAGRRLKEVWPQVLREVSQRKSWSIWTWISGFSSIVNKSAWEII